MNHKGQFSIIAALLVAVILVATVIITYSMIRNSPIQDQPQVLSAIDETNFAIKQILGFTVGYYCSVLQVTGNASYARVLAINYLHSGLVNIVNMHPEWGASFRVSKTELHTYWFTNTSYSTGNLAVTYNLTGLGVHGITYETSCRLMVQIENTISNNQTQLVVLKDEDYPLINLGKQNFRFFRYIYTSSTWQLVTPSNEPVAFANGTYIIDIPYGIDPDSYLIQVEDSRGLIVVASSFSRYTCTLTWNSTSALAQNYVDNDTSDVDTSGNKGTHSDFTAQQHGPDSIHDTLTEENTGGSYTELWSATFKPTVAASWEIKSLDSYGVPANSVAIIHIYQDESADVKRDAGVRAVGSSLNRYIPMHEAEAGGLVIVSMMVQVDSSKNIEIYAETIAANTISFRVIGYFKGVSYTEKFENWNPNYASTWTDKDLYTDYGVPKGNVAEIFVANADTSAQRNVGVRTDGSSLNRYILIHESESGGQDGFTMCVKTDVNTGRIECYNDGTTGHFYLLGYFDSTLDYVERMDSLAAATADVWEDETLPTPPDAVVEVLVENDAGWDQRYGGAKANPSSLDRRALIHEAEDGGLTGGRWTVQSDASSTIEIYEDRTEDIRFALVGYWNWTVKNYELDLEVQWKNAYHNGTNEELCIYVGTMGSEDIQVDVWNDSAWENLFSDLSSGWNNVSVSSYLDSSTFTLRFKGSDETFDTVRDSWEIDATLLHVWPTGDLYLSLPDVTIVVELLQNGTMRWLGQNLQLTTQTKPIPPIPVKALHVNQTVNGMNREVPFQVEDWASNYRIPLGLTNNASVFNSRTMLTFLANPKVSKVTIWWNGSDATTQTLYAYINRHFTVNTVQRTLSNGILDLEIDFSWLAGVNSFKVISTAGSSTSTAEFMRINDEVADYGNSEPTYAITNGTVRAVIHHEVEWDTGVPNCPNVYAHIVLTLPANVTFYTYQLRLMFVESGLDRTITDLCPIELTASTNQPQTENGTANGYPIISDTTGLFYNSSTLSWAHHWSQFTSGTKGAGIMFTDSANEMLYVFDSVTGNKTGALKVSDSIELLPIANELASAEFTNALDVVWHGAIVTFDGTAPIYKEDGATGLWMIVEYPPTITITTES